MVLARSKRRFGEIAVDLGLLRPDEVERGLRLQARLRERDRTRPLGLIFVRVGRLMVEEVQRVVAVQRAESQRFSAG